MSDHDAGPDPIDTAYQKAEALLNDDESRTARRARVLAAVARDHTTPSTVAASSRARHGWRRGGWLVAASVAGFGLFWAAELDPSQPRQDPPPVRTSSAPKAAQHDSRASSPQSGRAAPSSAPTSEAFAAASGTASLPPPRLRPEPRAFPAELARATTPPPDIQTPSLPIRPVRHPQPEAVGPPAPVPASPQAPPAPAPPPPPPPPPSPPAPQVANPMIAVLAEKLRAAAAAGRLAELETLLAEGASVDAPDADGDTALMKSVQADQPAATALLRRHGASLDQRNRAGLSARDMAREAGDPALDRALGLDR